jgi:PhoH-like ATPase
MMKTYILDTNVLIHDPNAMFNFEDNEVVIPIYVIEEIDKLKRAEGERGRNARVTARNLDDLRKMGSINEGVKLESGGFVRVETQGTIKELPNFMREDKVDNRIIAVALQLSKGEGKTILVTKDINMRIKADALHLEVQDYEADTVDFDELYIGLDKIEVETESYVRFSKSGKLKYSEILEKEPFANQFFNIVQGDKAYPGIYNKDKKRIEKFVYGGNIEAWGIRARNLEQECAMEILMDESIKVVTLVGKAGTGKTLLALAAALEQVVERKVYKKILVARPIVPMGKDIGYLPGGEKEKLRPWMQPIYDNFDFLAENKDDDSRAGEKVVSGLETMGMLKIEALTYIRGRTIPKGFIIIDEAQNLTPHEIKTIVTRAGADTKIVFTGDPYQIDNPYLDTNSNGLTYLAERFKFEKIAGHITLMKGERSELAELAAKLL